eukprot:TRINITY_DN2009_c0_g2_i1.p1 TRINITY_DN2009_c0_g2~~TRINITY_DN2009_c0_g2_i1.p1  ORF type:complete len:263 (+),score=74.79 TRINITY_DN2009_c0_g2_i1:71-859(+)
MAALPVVAAAALGFLGASSTSFVASKHGRAPQSPATTVAVAAQQPLLQQQPAATSSSALCAGFGFGAIVGAAAVARTARRAGDITKADGPFAGGLVGSEYAGFGTYQWDPLELTKEYPEHLPWYREAELKHGRIAMLACIGALAQDSFRLPIDVLQDPELNILNSHNQLIFGLGQGPMWWLLVPCAVIESLRFKQLGLDFGKLTLETAGDMDFGKGFAPKTKEGMEQMKIKELKNGRLAMLGFSGLITQAAFFNQPHFPYYG